LFKIPFKVHGKKIQKEYFHKFYYRKTTLNYIFGTNLQDLFFELCDVTEKPINKISSIEDIKNSLYEHLAFEYSELISSITNDNLPSIIITLYLNNLESWHFQPSNIGYYLLHAA
jgi:hypothetical protein